MGMYQTVNTCYGILTTVQALKEMTVIVEGEKWNMIGYINEWPERLPGWLHCYTEEDEPWAVVGAKMQSELRTVDRIVAPGVQEVGILSSRQIKVITHFLHDSLGLDGDCKYYVVVTW